MQSNKAQVQGVNEHILAFFCFMGNFCMLKQRYRHVCVDTVCMWMAILKKHILISFFTCFKYFAHSDLPKAMQKVTSQTTIAP